MKTRLAALALALAVPGALLTASAASAGEVPTPGPSVTQNFGFPPTPSPLNCLRQIPVPHVTPTPHITPTRFTTPTDEASLDAWHGTVPTPQPFGIRQPCLWQFDLAQLDIGGIHVNDVEQFGALGRLHNWHDTQLSPTLDRFSRGGSSLVLRHPGLPVPVVNLRTCTATFVQHNAPFNLVPGAGTGIGSHIGSVNGRYELAILLSWQYNHGVCPLVSVSPFTLRNEVENGTPPAQPTEADVAVQGEALLVRV
jgi:hypothetical protein